MTLEKLEDRLAAAEKRIAHFDKILWVVAIVGAVFGASGAFGLRALWNAGEEIQALQEKIGNLTTSVDQASEIIRQATSEATAEVRSYAQGDEVEQLVKNHAGSIISLSDVERVVQSHESSPRPLTVSSLSVVNEDGKSVVQIAEASSGGGLVSVNDPSGNQRAALASLDTGGVIQMRNQNNDVYALLRFSENREAPYFILQKKKDLPIFVVHADSDGGIARIYNKEGQESLFIASTTRGNGILQVNAYDGKKERHFSPAE